MASCTHFFISFLKISHPQWTMNQVHSHTKEKNKWQGVKSLPSNKYGKKCKYSYQENSSFLLLCVLSFNWLFLFFQILVLLTVLKRMKTCLLHFCKHFYGSSVNSSAAFHRDLIFMIVIYLGLSIRVPVFHFTNVIHSRCWTFLPSYLVVKDPNHGGC